MNQNEFHTVRGYQLMEDKTKITSAMEDYLEMMMRHNEEGRIRVSKLAELLNVKDSSATKMVQRLGVFGLLKYEKYGMIVLTKKGVDIGTYLLKRHKVIEDFLRILNTDNLLVETELLEHNVSPGTVNNLELLLAFFSINPDILNRYIEFIHTYPKNQF